MKKYCVAIMIVLFSGLSFAQDDSYVVSTALPALTFQQSPLFIGAGQIGTAVPMEDPLGFYFNPAQLGYFSQKNNLAASAMPQKSIWSNPISKLTFTSFGAAAGYNFKPKYNVPLSIGIGYIHNKFSFGIFNVTGPDSPASLGQVESYDGFDCFSFGASYNYYLQFNLGLSVKSLKSVLGARLVNNKIDKIDANSTAYDFGMMITAPAAQLFFNNVKYNLSYDSYIKPKFDITLGYSLANLGKEIWFIDPAQKNPLPRTARMGYTLELGADLYWKEISINAIDYTFTAEADDILVERENNGSTKYKGMFGGISPVKNLIKLNSDRDVVIHRGNILRLFETLYITSGKYYGRGLDNTRSRGYGFSSEGIFKLISNSVDNSSLRFIIDHLTFEYYNTNDFIDHRFFKDTNFQGVAIYLKGIAI